MELCPFRLMKAGDAVAEDVGKRGSGMERKLWNVGDSYANRVLLR